MSLSLTDRSKASIDRVHTELSHDKFNQYILEILCQDINDIEQDNRRVDILRYLVEKGYLY